MGDIPTWLVAVGAIVSAIATCFIAWYAVVNHKLANAIKTKDEQHQQEIKDLYQAIVLSTLATTFTGGSREDGYKWFVDKYKSENIPLDQLTKSS